MELPRSRADAAFNLPQQPDGKKMIEKYFCDNRLHHLMPAFFGFVVWFMRLHWRRDGKKIVEKTRLNNTLSSLMPALFGRQFDKQKGSLTLPESAAGTDRSRYISKGDLHEFVD